MKKFFLLSLLSVFLLSAFSQSAGVHTEILTQFTIIRSADADADADDDMDIERYPYLPNNWLFFYRWVLTEPLPFGGFVVKCTGWGPFMCLAVPYNFIIIRGISNETVEKTIEEIIFESGKRAENEEYTGTISKKIATADGQSFLLFQMNWDYDPNNIRNGKAEVIISQTKDFGLR